MDGEGPPSRAGTFPVLRRGQTSPFPTVLSRATCSVPEAGVGDVGAEPLTRKVGELAPPRLVPSARPMGAMSLHLLGHGDEPLCSGPAGAARNCTPGI